MHAKKKTRARNRPRNKCNQTNEHRSEPDGGEIGVGGAGAGVGVGAYSVLEPLQSEPARAEPDTSAIYLIQKLLRKKLLAKANSSSPSNPPIAQAKASSPLRKPSPLGNKNDEVNDLLKCIGNNLQKGSYSTSIVSLLSGYLVYSSVCGE